MKISPNHGITAEFWTLIFLSPMDPVGKTGTQHISVFLKASAQLIFSPCNMKCRMRSLLNYALVTYNVFLTFFWVHNLCIISHAKTVQIAGEEIILQSKQIIFLQCCMLRIHLRNDPHETTSEHCAILIYLFLPIRLIMGIPAHCHHALLSVPSQFYDPCPRCTHIHIKCLKWSINLLFIHLFWLLIEH